MSYLDNLPSTALPATRILLVEDDVFISEIYQTKFTKEGHTIIHAHNGQDALNKLADASIARPELILCDIVMAQMGGFEFLAEREKHPEWKDVPVIMLTNVGEPEHYSLAEQYGVIGYIIKANYMPSDVLKRIGKFMYEYRQSLAESNSQSSSQLGNDNSSEDSIVT